MTSSRVVYVDQEATVASIYRQYPDLEVFKTTRDTGLEKSDTMIIDSERVIMRAVERQIVLQRLLITPAYAARHDTFIQSLPSSTTVYVAPRSFIETFVGQRVHQCMMALATRPAYVPCEHILEAPRIAYLQGMNDAQNVGAIIRNCHAFGFEAVIIDERTCSPYVRRSIRVAMGSVFYVKVALCTGFSHTYSLLKNSGFDVICADLTPSSVPIEQIRKSKKIALVLGQEFEGVSDEVRSRCDQSVMIPIAKTVDSLNVACASAILLHAFRSDRTTFSAT